MPLAVEKKEKSDDAGLSTSHTSNKRGERARDLARSKQPRNYIVQECENGPTLFILRAVKTLTQLVGVNRIAGIGVTKRSNRDFLPLRQGANTKERGLSIKRPWPSANR